MCTGLEVAMIAGGLASTAATMYTGQKQASQQKQAMNTANKNAKQQAALAEQDMNRRNAKQPNVAALAGANGAQTGQATTMLTGPSGVDPNSLLLGKNVLLGA